MSNSSMSINKFTTVQSFYVHTPLYIPYELPDKFNDEIKKIWLQTEEYTIDCYCMECKKESVFNAKLEFDTPSLHTIFNKPEINPQLKYANFNTEVAINKTLTCTRNRAHQVHILIKILNKKIIKVGQYPSYVDLSEQKIKQYRKIISQNDYSEFSRAIGLASHGVGIGAFVYLRRIFEKLVEGAHIEAKKDTDWNEEAYKRSRMDEKIDLLSKHLPATLVQQKSLYGILSSGIHGLSEVECLQAFPIVRLGIELILDEKIRKLEESRKLIEASDSISKLSQLLQQQKSQPTS